MENTNPEFWNDLMIYEGLILEKEKCNSKADSLNFSIPWTHQSYSLFVQEHNPKILRICGQ